MTEDDFLNKVLGNAQKLCTESADRYMDSKKSNNIDYDADADKWDAMYLGEQAATEQRQMSTGANNTKMPKAIMQEMVNNPVDTRALEVNPLDRMDLSKHTKGTKQVKQVMNEQQTFSNPQGIDYTIIKAIVNECLESKLSAMKTPLNEGASLSTIGLKNGRIKLVDSKGNIFEAKLERIGNVNDK